MDFELNISPNLSDIQDDRNSLESFIRKYSTKSQLFLLVQEHAKIEIYIDKLYLVVEIA